MIAGVTAGYEKRLEIQGVGYLAAVQGKVLQLRVGLANELQVPIPDGLKVTVPDQQHIVIQGIEKQLVGHFAASVRAMRKPEPYKGKGIRRRCRICGRPRAVYRKFGICRICFRKLADNGLISGSAKRVGKGTQDR